VDSEELAGQLDAASGWRRTEDEDADVVLVNTCGFIDAAKQDSIDTLLAAGEAGSAVVAIGCMAERYGAELADALPEAAAVLGFDSYADIVGRLDDVAAGRAIAPHRPRDRRLLLPVSPAHRPAAMSEVVVPGHAWLPGGVARTRLDDSPTAYLKLASGCDRRCSFCAIPSFRGSFVSRAPEQVIAEARWLGETGAREIVLVSENSTSYGKDLGDVRSLERLLGELADLDGVDRIRVAYLQPAEMRPGLVQVLAATPGVAPYFDLSFQHASPAVLRRMRRFGGTEPFLRLLDDIRAIDPQAGARSNVIVGFPGETEDDLSELEAFLDRARLDAVGVFAYSDEEGTEAAGLDGKVPPEVIAARVERISSLAAELMNQRAEDRADSVVDVLVEQVGDVDRDGAAVFGRAAHQGPDSDGCTTVLGVPRASSTGTGAVVPVGSFVRARVVEADGVDLVARFSDGPW
jgi:ribosomal protein S12 methylthiotransferase RimO